MSIFVICFSFCFCLLLDNRKKSGNVKKKYPALLRDIFRVFVYSPVQTITFACLITLSWSLYHFSNSCIIIHSFPGSWLITSCRSVSTSWSRESNDFTHIVSSVFIIPE
ncbi:TPA: hypothetical protein DEG21_04440 [Patescibacteria group bacterium]|nr:hypothetical protein [Candidatus Gracilibacteria bacterium]HBY75085.1 hypothetical protein [Candidatus Gracilibacteria bacterium]